MSNRKLEEEKKRLGGGSFALFLLAIFLGVMWVQTLFEPTLASVHFSYQLEHLINLDLLKPNTNSKTATLGNRVRFSGRFRETTSEAGQSRYHYLELLNRKYDVTNHLAALSTEITTLQPTVIASLNAYRTIAGTPDASYTLKADSSIPTLYPPSNKGIDDQTISQRSLVSLEKRAAKLTPEQFPLWHDDFKQWLLKLQEPQLGIGDPTVKRDIETLLSSLDNIPPTSSQSSLSQIPLLLQQASKIILKVKEPQSGWLFASLRSVRALRDKVEEYHQQQTRQQQVNAQLAQQLPLVADVIWFYQGHELSTHLLSQQPWEEFQIWFNHAKHEWDAMATNQGLLFEAIDQPSTPVLEQLFLSQEPAIDYLNILLSLFNILIFPLMVYLFFNRQIKNLGASGGGPFQFGKSPAKVLDSSKQKVTFKDVAGIDEAREELEEIVSFLKNPVKFQQLGAEIPKGVLCVGPPGTGKTLIARAVAGEAGCPFFSISGSDFVEMFVGVGASRIRDMFKEAKKQAPCIIFMDEIDAVGRHRGVGVGGGHDEREQTLNQLLVELDGFDNETGVILIAATNREEVLDKALLRPGRFDRRVTISLPDIKGRYEILKLHAAKIKIDPQIDLMRIARAMPGSSGADLKNLLNEAALKAVQAEHTQVKLSDVDYALDKVRFGKERRSLEMTQEEIKRTAYHEAGHTIVGMLSPHCDPVDKVTIIPRGSALGATYSLPKGNRVGYATQELHQLLAMLIAGRVAEEIFLGDVSSGASNDILRITNLVRTMVCEWGMSKKLGEIAYKISEDTPISTPPYAASTGEAIDQQVREWVEQAHQRAYDLLNSHRNQTEALAKYLIEFETLDADEIRAVIEQRFDPAAKEQSLRASTSSDTMAASS